jgi:hypothetical protein
MPARKPHFIFYMLKNIIIHQSIGSRRIGILPFVHYFMHRSALEQSLAHILGLILALGFVSELTQKVVPWLYNT